MRDMLASSNCRQISWWLLSLLVSAVPPASAEALEEDDSAPVMLSISDDDADSSLDSTDDRKPNLSRSEPGWQTGTCRCGSNSFHRAGHPEYVKRGAIPSDNGRYGGYYIGGGIPLRGEEPCVYHEGTWGWDYFGGLFPKRIALNWSHGRRHQGGTGAYKTDGPKLLHH